MSVHLQSDCGFDFSCSFLIKEYLDEIKLYLKDINNVKKPDTWKTQLTIAVNFISTKGTKIPLKFMKNVFFIATKALCSQGISIFVLTSWSYRKMFSLERYVNFKIYDFTT